MLCVKSTCCQEGYWRLLRSDGIVFCISDGARNAHKKGWPDPYKYTVNDRILGDFPAQNTVYTPYICGFGQPYKVSKEKAFSQEL
jgi:hypothetical protein